MDDELKKLERRMEKKGTESLSSNETKRNKEENLIIKITVILIVLFLIFFIILNFGFVDIRSLKN